MDMRSLSQVADELNNIIHAHYYSEDFELISSIKAFYDSLAPVEKSYLEQTVLSRLTSEGSIVDILLCSVVRVPSAAPVLASRLNREEVSNQMTRTLIAALKTYRSDEAYTAVERFMDSDQELETLQALAAIDFRRAIPRIVLALKKESAHGVILHIFHERMKTAGLSVLVDDLCHSSATRTASFKSMLVQSLHSKKDPYNPFSENDIQHIIRSVEVV